MQISLFTDPLKCSFPTSPFETACVKVNRPSEKQLHGKYPVFKGHAPEANDPGGQRGICLSPGRAKTGAPAVGDTGGSRRSDLGEGVSPATQT